MKDNQRHLTLSHRIIIEKGLNEGLTFTAIASKIDKDPSTISKEIRKHRTLKQHRKNYQPQSCGRLDKPPYVCNSCKSLCSCHYFRYIYVAKCADDSYHELLFSSREGINQSGEGQPGILFHTYIYHNINLSKKVPLFIR